MTTSAWTVRDTESGKKREFDSRAAAERAIDELEDLGMDVELVAPTSAEKEPVALEVIDADTDADAVDPAAYDLPDRSISDDPLEWVPGEFIDEIDGTQAINRKGFEVLSHFYDIDVETDVQVPPHETGFTYCQVKAAATTPDGRRCEALGSAHVDRGDDSVLLLELADTRARKRALSIATGVGAVAVEELKNEFDR
ncbi:hypothetical protein [Natronococcus pandeyae]|uniref:hypothetical protein n=1 Tax=Natronococcus pandeyae TaxID=2055836 RepID=UPI0011E825AB|nr:hypothetical protein [Natronococcus pandeyae]